MTFVSWASLYEGTSDAAYFEVLIPRLIEEILLVDGVRNTTVATGSAVFLGSNGRGVEAVAEESCQASSAFHLVFIHADTGGRGLQQNLAAHSVAYCQAMADLCGWKSERCITITPSRETEAWVLADPNAVTAAFGYNGTPASVGLPANARAAERLNDPKAVLVEVVASIRKRRSRPSPTQLFPAVAQRQSIASLRQAASFRAFESSVRRGLADIGCIAA
jgi:Domain of unknown function (DUF4276)